MHTIYTILTSIIKLTRKQADFNQARFEKKEKLDFLFFSRRCGLPQSQETRLPKSHRQHIFKIAQNLVIPPPPPPWGRRK